MLLRAVAKKMSGAPADERIFGGAEGPVSWTTHIKKIERAMGLWGAASSRLKRWHAPTGDTFCKCEACVCFRQSTATQTNLVVCAICLLNFDTRPRGRRVDSHGMRVRPSLPNPG